MPRYSRSWPGYIIERGPNVTAADGSDWSRDAPLLFWRQRHQLGNEQILAQITRHFRVPPANVSQPAASAT